MRLRVDVVALSDVHSGVTPRARLDAGPCALSVADLQSLVPCFAGGIAVGLRAGGRKAFIWPGGAAPNPGRSTTEAVVTADAYERSRILGQAGTSLVDQHPE